MAAKSQQSRQRSTPVGPNRSPLFPRGSVLASLVKGEVGADREAVVRAKKYRGYVAIADHTWIAGADGRRRPPPLQTKVVRMYVDAYTRKQVHDNVYFAVQTAMANIEDGTLAG